MRTVFKAVTAALFVITPALAGTNHAGGTVVGADVGVPAAGFKEPVIPSTAYSLLFGKLSEPAVRWSPCTRIEWKLDQASYTPERLLQTTKAFRVIRKATGLPIRYAGLASKEETADNPGDMIIVSFVSRSAAGARVGGFTWTSTLTTTTDTESREWIDHADVHIVRNVSRFRTSGYLPVLLHEIGHAVGLGHSGDLSSIMYPYLRGTTRLSAGDRAGFARVGASHGCGSVPNETPDPVPAPDPSTVPSPDGGTTGS